MISNKYVHTTQVFYDDTDATGFVYHAHYLRMAERARTIMLNQVGFDHTGLKRNSYGTFVVKNLEINYFQPAKLDDCLTIHTSIAELRGASIKIIQHILKDSQIIVRMTLKLALIGINGRPLRLPLELKQVFSS